MDCERVILGLILFGKDQGLIHHIPELKAEDFSLHSHRVIFSVVQSMAKRGEPIDVVLVAAEIEKMCKIETVGGVEYLSSLKWEAIGNIEFHAGKVRDYALRQLFVKTCESAITQAHDPSEPTMDCLSVTQDKLLNLSADLAHRQGQRISEFSDGVYHKIEKMAVLDKQKKAIGYRTGLSWIDEVTGGGRPKEYWIYAGDSNQGKSPLLAQTIMANLEDGVPCGLFTPEMSREQSLLRFIPAITQGKVTPSLLRDPRHMTPPAMSIFKQTKEIIDGWPLWVDDTTRLDIAELVARARLWIRRYKVKVIGVDYIQLMRAKNAESRKDRVDAISEGLRELAKTEKIWVIGVSQLSRDKERSKGREPILSDLKESSNLENDSHTVVFVYRPQEQGSFTGKDVLKVGKQREGPIGRMEAKFDSDRLIFTPRDGEDEGYQGGSLNF